MALRELLDLRGEVAAPVLDGFDVAGDRGGMMRSAVSVPGTVTVCSPIAWNMPSMMRPARGPLALARALTFSAVSVQ